MASAVSGRRRGRRALAVALAVALLLSGCGGSGTSSMSATSTKVTLIRAVDPAYPTVAGTGDGFEAVWSEPDGIWSDYWNGHLERWGSPRRLYSGQSVEGSPTAVAGSVSGATVVAWVVGGQGEAGDRLYVRYRASDGRWQPAFSLPGGGTLREQSIAVDRAGNGYVVWATGPSHDEIVMSEHRATGTSWSQPETIARAQLTSGPELAVSASGSESVAWTAVLARAPSVPRRTLDERSQDPSEAFLATRNTADQPWRAVRLGPAGLTVTGAEDIEWPQDPLSVGITSSNTTYVGWQALNPKLRPTPELAKIEPASHLSVRHLDLPAGIVANYPYVTSDGRFVSVLTGDWLGSYDNAGRLHPVGRFSDKLLDTQPELTQSICSKFGSVSPVPGVAVGPRERSMTVWQPPAQNGSRSPIVSFLLRCR
jgi:hypothetical protein